MSGPIRSAARNGFVCSVGSAFSYIKNQKCANPQFRTYAFLQHDPMYLRAAGGFARKKTHDGSAIGFTQKRHTLCCLLYLIFHRSASSSFGGGSRSGATCMSRRLPAAGAVPKAVFRTVDGSGTLCLWKDSLLQKGCNWRARHLPIFRMYWSAFRQSSAHRPDAPHCPSVRYCAAPRGATACARQAAGRRFAVQTIYYNV